MAMNVTVLLYDDVEVLDFAGPVEVFTTASRVAGKRSPGSEPPFALSTVARERRTIRARAGLTVVPDADLTDPRPIDVLIVPGGVTAAEEREEETIAWIATIAAKARITASICTGVFLLGRAGLLDGRTITTHWEDLADLRVAFPAARVVDGVRWVDEGDVVTSAGISAGIDMSLHLVERLTGRELADRTARQMDYERRAEA